MKKFICSILILIMILPSAVSQAAEGAINDAIKIQVNGRYLTMDVAPVIVNDRTLVPIRVIAEALGAQVLWHEAVQTVNITLGDTAIELYIGKISASVNENAAELDAAACIIEDRTFVPLRFIAEAMDADVDWDGEVRTVIIQTESPLYAFIGNVGYLDKSESKIQAEVVSELEEYSYDGARVIDVAPTVRVDIRGDSKPAKIVKAEDLAKELCSIPNAKRAVVDAAAIIELDEQERLTAITVLSMDLHNEREVKVHKSEGDYKITVEGFEPFYYDDNTKAIFLADERFGASVGYVLPLDGFIYADEQEYVYGIDPVTRVASVVVIKGQISVDLVLFDLMIVDTVRDMTNEDGELVSEITYWANNEKHTGVTTRHFPKEDLTFGTACLFYSGWNGKISPLIPCSTIGKKGTASAGKFNISGDTSDPDEWWNKRSFPMVLLAGTCKMVADNTIRLDNKADIAGIAQNIKWGLKIETAPIPMPEYETFGGLYEGYMLADENTEISPEYGTITMINTKTRDVKMIEAKDAEETADALRGIPKNAQVLMLYFYSSLRHVVFLI